MVCCENRTSASTKDEFLTVREASQLLKINEATVRRYISAGVLPSVKVGSRRLVVRSEIGKTDTREAVV